MQVKNERLYAFLRHFFKRVRVQNAGMPFQYRVVRHGSEKNIHRVDSGEEYAICCPVCKETRFRLNINHVFGEFIEGMEMRHVVHCWNEDCEVSTKLLAMYEEFCELLPGELTPIDVQQLDGPFSMEAVVEECKKNLLRVKGITRIDALPAEHPAVQYLAARRFNNVDLGLVYGIGYCHNDSYNARMAHKRLIIPILYRGGYVGWQSRAIPGMTKLTLDKKKIDKPWPYRQPKYWTSTGTRKSFFLYAYETAAKQDTVVVSEGPTDAWRVGPCGTASLGRRISLYQRKLIAETWSEKPGKIVLIGDPGFEDDWRLNKEMLDKEVGEPGKVVLCLPKDKDPGDMTRKEVWEMIHERSKK